MPDGVRCDGIDVEWLWALQVLLLDELTTFLDGEDQRGVLEAVRACVGGPDQACVPPVNITGSCAVRVCMFSCREPILVAK